MSTGSINKYELVSEAEKLRMKGMRSRGFSYAAISKKTGRSLNTVKSYTSNVTPVKKQLASRKLPEGVRLPSLSAYLRGGGTPRAMKHIQRLIYLDTEVVCGHKLLQKLIDRWKQEHLGKCPLRLQMIWTLFDRYQGAYLENNGFIRGSWNGLATQVDRLIVGESVEKPWVKFFGENFEFVEEWLEEISLEVTNGKDD
jgi:hypothetical protein